MKCEDKEQDKQVKLSAARHHQLKIIAAKEKREMREIVSTALDFYFRNRNKENSS
ncbi:hypothetical protein [Cytobacillus horneckiae]|uniref:hypothetical protein n=1 Tax=Cytobacillus horneckiae TaxID=549687 RepID=UPI000B287CAE|nr:hypothetical protein [Cytobacillus horneckiae]MEC1158690.1 hypothetical protein [Cytobacillus horneckiae]NRG46648.1 hypothetical protein [Bacillus sp. CRN 9]